MKTYRKSNIMTLAAGLALALTGLMSTATATAQRHWQMPKPMEYRNTSREWKQIARQCPDSFLLTPEAMRIADNVLLYQRVTGGWPKNLPIHRILTGEEEMVMAEKGRRNDSTTDNDATITEMRYLARLYHMVPQERLKEAFLRGVDFMLAGQYPSGGWPQFWPENRGYQKHITYNDNAMVQTMEMIRDLRDERPPFDGLVGDSLRRRLKEAFDRGIECILQTQIRRDGRPTVWCQQHDSATLEPAKARAYELPSFCSLESVRLVELLMSVPSPDERIVEAVEGAVAWFEAHKLTGIRVELFTDENGLPDRRVVSDPEARPTWARFYDLQTEQPFFCDRDGVPRKTLAEVGQERRGGYGWYSEQPGRLPKLYQEWKKRIASR